MAERGPPSVHTLINLLQKCRSSKSLSDANLLHSCLCQHHLESHRVLRNYLVPMHVDCGSLPDAYHVLINLPYRNLVSWNCLLHGYVDSGEFLHTFFLYDQMKEGDVHPNSYTFVALLKACARLKDLARGSSVHSDVIENGFQRDPFVVNALVNMYIKCSSIREARAVFNEFTDHSAVSWTVLMVGYAEWGLGEEALACIEEMETEGVAPDAVAFLSGLKACGILGCSEKARTLHAHAIKRGFESDASVRNTVADMYGKCGLLTEARQVLGTLLAKPLVSWNALIARYDEHGLSEEAIICFQQMRLDGVVPDHVTTVSSLKACSNSGDIETSRDIHNEAVVKGFDTEVVIGNTLISLYSKFGFILEARQVFEKLLGRDFVSWNALIMGYAENNLWKEALFCFEEMQQEGLLPDIVTYVCILKVCGCLKAVERGREIWKKIRAQGLDGDLIVGRMVVDMFAKCGSLVEAEAIFLDLSLRDPVSWTTLIMGFTEHGCWEKALEAFDDMQEDIMPPDDVTFLCCLKACAAIPASNKGQLLHVEIVKRGFDSSLFVGSAVIDMYAKCSLLREAQEAFDQLPVRNVVTWTALIGGYADNGVDDEALKCFEQMDGDGISPDASTFVCCLKACGNSGYLARGRELRAEIAQKGWEGDHLVGNSLVDMFVKCGSLVEAHEAFKKLRVHNAVSWNALIAGYAEHGLGDMALACFEQMQQDDVLPDTVTFLCTLKACSTIGAIEIGRGILTMMMEMGLDVDLTLNNTLIDMLGREGLLMEAQRIFDRLPVQGVISWNALITGYAEHALGKKALGCFDQMQLEATCPDVTTCICGLKACSIIGASERGQEIHAEIIKKAFVRELFVGNTLLDMYAKCGLLVEARNVFDTLLLQDAVSWAVLVAGYAEYGSDLEVLKCFEQLQGKDVLIENVTLVHFLKACSCRGALDTGREIHAEIRKLGLENDLYMGNMLIDMYGKCGSLREGKEVFDKMLVRDVVSWNALMKSYAENHEGGMAVQCFDKMRECGVKPDAITFTCLLVACSHASLVEEGQEHFRMMIDVYNIEPTVYHYLCLVDLLARSGHVHEAEKLIEDIQGHSLKEVLTALLSACKNYGKLEVGLRCFQQLVEVNNGDAAAHLLMADAYASSGRCDDANRIEELRRHMGAAKKPGSALLEVNKTLHEFMVDDMRRRDLSGILENISLRMKDDGYMPNLDILIRGITEGDGIVSGIYIHKGSASNSLVKQKIYV